MPWHNLYSLQDNRAEFWGEITDLESLHFKITTKLPIILLYSILYFNASFNLILNCTLTSNFKY